MDAVYGLTGPGVRQHLSVLDYDNFFFFFYFLDLWLEDVGRVGVVDMQPSFSCAARPASVARRLSLISVAMVAMVRVRLWALIMKFEVCSRLPRVTMEHLIEERA